MSSICLLRVLLLFFTFLSGFPVRGRDLQTTPAVQRRFDFSFEDLSLQRILDRNINNQNAIRWVNADVLIQHSHADGLQAVEGYPLTIYGWENPDANLLILLAFPRLTALVWINRWPLRNMLQGSPDDADDEEFYETWVKRPIFSPKAPKDGDFGKQIVRYLNNPMGPKQPPKGLIMAPKKLSAEYPERMQTLTQWIKRDTEHLLSQLTVEHGSMKVESWKVIEFGQPPNDNEVDVEACLHALAEEDDSSSDSDSDDGWDTDITEPVNQGELRQLDEQLDRLEGEELRNEGGKIGIAWLCTDPASKQWEWGIFTTEHDGNQPTISDSVKLDLRTI